MDTFSCDSFEPAQRAPSTGVKGMRKSGSGCFVSGGDLSAIQSLSP